jgi:thioredoxin-related protein
MTSLAAAAAVVAVVVVLALVLRRRQRPDAPTQPQWQVPSQLDRDDFVRPEAPWLVAVFTSSTCHVCADVARKARVLESSEVAVHDVEFAAERDLHRRYRIDAVPTLVIADAAGVVRASFLGPVTATDLWCAMAEVREPGSTPQGQGCQRPE